MKYSIHPTAIVDKRTEISEDVEIGPYCIIGPEVKIGRGTRIGAYTYIEKWTVIGEDNLIYPHVIMGVPPQDLKYRGEKSWVKVGNGNVIREFTTIHRAGGEGESTIVGDRNYLMAYSHVAHNCKIGNGVILANAVALAGYVQVEDYAILGGLVGAHQFTRVGTLSIVGGCSKVVKDVVPYLKVDGHPLKVYGLNTLGLRRHGIPEEKISLLKKAYRILFRSGLNTTEALKVIRKELPPLPEILHLLEFIELSQRGIHK